MRLMESLRSAMPPVHPANVLRPCAGHGATAFGKADGFGLGKQHFGAVDSAPAGERLDADDMATGGLDLRLEAELDPVAADGRFEGSVASRRSGRRDRSIRRPLPPNIGQCHLAWNGLTPGKALLPTRHSGAHRFGTVAPSREMPMLWPVNATRSSSASPSATLRRMASAGRLDRPGGTGRRSAVRRRYSWAEADAAQTLVALGGDGFMLQTLHAMLEEGEARPVFGMNRGTSAS